ncbi:MAG: YARHG domain-containing protein [Lachnospiraceae bacterium]|nr:YARHG domain-containing protein [Lachnospiraceae bacterium]
MSKKGIGKTGLYRVFIMLLLFAALFVFSKNTAYARDYIIADSDSRYLSDADVEGLSLREINYAKNEIYARCGRKFNSVELQAWFNSKSWYQGVYEPADFDANYAASVMNSYEKVNAEFLSDVEYSIDPNGYQLDVSDYTSFIEAEKETESTAVGTETVSAELVLSIYREILEMEYFTIEGDDGYVGGKILGFQLMDLNGDGIPELLLWIDRGTVGHTLVSCREEKIVKLYDDTNPDMQFHYYSDSNTLMMEYEQNGVNTVSCYTCENDEFICKAQRVVNNSSDLSLTGGKTILYYVDGVEVTETEYIVIIAVLIVGDVQDLVYYENTAENRDEYLKSWLTLADTVYADILNEYRRAVAEKFEGSYENISNTVHWLTGESGQEYGDFNETYGISYALYDFLGDGQPELLIGLYEKGSDAGQLERFISLYERGSEDAGIYGYNGNSCVDVFCTDGNTVRRVDSEQSWPYTFYHFCENGIVMGAYMSGGPSAGGFSIFQLYANQASAELVTEYGHNGGGNYFCCATTGEELSSEEYYEIMDSYVMIEDIGVEWIPIS